MSTIPPTLPRKAAPSIIPAIAARPSRGLIKDSTIMTIKRPVFTPTRRDVINTIASLPLAAAAPTAAAAAPIRDAGLIELGARFEPLLDQYYAAERRWSGSGSREAAAAMSA